MGKPRKKKHNHIARARKFFGHKTRVWTWESELDSSGDQIAYAQKFMGTFWRTLRPDVVRRIIEEKQNWCVCVRVVRDYGESDYRVDSNVFIVKSVALVDLNDIYEKAKEEILRPIKRSDIYDIGWLAETYINKLPDDSERWHLKCLNPTVRVTDLNKELWRAADEREINEINI